MGNHLRTKHSIIVRNGNLLPHQGNRQGKNLVSQRKPNRKGRSVRLRVGVYGYERWVLFHFLKALPEAVPLMHKVNIEQLTRFKSAGLNEMAKYQTLIHYSLGRLLPAIYAGKI